MSPVLLDSYRGAAAGSSHVLPVTSNLIFWFKRGVGMYQSGTTAPTTPASANGDPVKWWMDSGPNSYALFANGSTFPALDTSDTWQGGNTVHTGSNGSNGYTIYDNTSPTKQKLDLSALTQGEIFLTVKLDLDPPVNTALTGLWHFYASGSTNHYPWTDGIIYDAFGSNSRRTVGNPTPSLSSTYRVYNVFSRSSTTGDPDGNTNKWQAFLDNSSIFNDTSNTVAFPIAAEIGSDTPSFSMSGRLVEVVMYSAKLSTADRTSVYNFLTS